jgi:hypothetical protein
MDEHTLWCMIWQSGLGDAGQLAIIAASDNMSPLGTMMLSIYQSYMDYKTHTHLSRDDADQHGLRTQLGLGAAVGKRPRSAQLHEDLKK